MEGQDGPGIRGGSRLIHPDCTLRHSGHGDHRLDHRPADGSVLWRVRDSHHLPVCAHRVARGGRWGDQLARRRHAALHLLHHLLRFLLLSPRSRRRTRRARARPRPLPRGSTALLSGLAPPPSRRRPPPTPTPQQSSPQLDHGRCVGPYKAVIFLSHGFGHSAAAAVILVRDLIGDAPCAACNGRIARFTDCLRALVRAGACVHRLS
mmetsp:Transcript_37795/g.121544  ORF Transcript_37795/g.121544 Transcript_37795/m.121544 type:complete len:207 (+) Transcript_37795:1216-1836(+)